MKNAQQFIIGFLFALVIGLMAFSPTDRPSQQQVKSFRSMFGLEKEMEEYISKMIAQGWVVKSVAMMDDDTWSKGIVVMEK